MRLSVIISLGVSAVLGTAAVVVARVWMGPSNKPAVVHTPAIQTAPMVVAGSALAYGDQIDANKLVVVRFPKDLIPAGAFGSIDQVVGGPGGAPVVLTPIAAREAILPDKISGGGARKSVSVLIEPGMRAFSIRISDVSGVGGHVLPGDRVDVMLTREPTPSATGAVGSNTTAVVIVQNVRVLGINLNADPASTSAADTAEPKTATLEVSLQDAQRLSVASGVGTLSLALRRPGAIELAKVRTVLVKDVSPATSGSASGAAPHSAQARPAPDETISSVIIVQGDKSTSVSVPVETLGGT